MFRSFFRPQAVPGTGVIQAQQLKTQLDAGDDIVLVDVRSADEYAYDGHIAGSRLLPLFTLPLRHHELPKDKPIVCVCRSGARSQVACEQLNRLGFTNTINLQGGIIGWRMAGLPVSH